MENVVLQVQTAQDADLHTVTESLLCLHQRATIVTSLKTWISVFHVSVIICVVCITTVKI